jgi:hypothetical protein
MIDDKPINNSKRQAFPGKDRAERGICPLRIICSAPSRLSGKLAYV